MAYRLTQLRFFLIAATLVVSLYGLTTVAAMAQAQAASPTQHAADPDDDGADGTDATGPDDNGPAPDDGVDPDWDPWLDAPDSEEDVTLPTVTTQTVAGDVAALRTNGKAAIPVGAPKAVRVLISQANKIVGKPFRSGGGHKKLRDSAYDDSGAVSFALVKSKMLKRTIVAGKFKRWGMAGSGRWISVYARKSHVYLEVAGLRLDTNPVGDATKSKGVRWRPVTGKRSGFTARHRAGL